MAAPTFVAATQGRNGAPVAANSLTLDVPAGAAGDLLIAVVGVKINPATTTPVGWTPIIAGFNGCTSAPDPQVGIRAQLSAWWRIADGSESTVTVSFGPEVLRQASGGVLRYSGAAATDPIDAFACAKGTSAAPAAPSVTTTGADDRVLRLVVADADDAQSLFTVEPATRRFEVASTSVFGPGSSYTSDAVVTSASDAAQAAAGATGTAAWALPAADQWAAMTVAIRPSGGASAQDGCVAAIVAIIRAIIEAIIDAINRALKALAGWFSSRRARRS